MHPIFMLYHKNRKGYILITTIVVIALISTIVAMLTSNVVTNLHLSNNFQEGLQVKTAVESAVEVALYEIAHGSTSSRTVTTMGIQVHYTVSGTSDQKVITAYPVNTKGLKAVVSCFKYNGRWYISKWKWQTGVS